MISRGRRAARVLFSLAALVLCLAAGAAAQVQRYAIGNQANPWRQGGLFDAIDDETQAGWIQPKQTSLDVNILRELFEKNQLYASKEPPSKSFRLGQDGRIWSINIPVTENRNLLMLADGRTDTLSFNYFNRLASNAGVAIEIDLGVPFPVSEIRFYPLDFGTHLDQFIKGYELFANDGSPETRDSRGEPIYRLLDADATNSARVVRNSNFSPQHMRFIKLRVTSPQSFELDQVEIRGEGFVRRAVFTSHIIDLGDIANFGRLLWHIEEAPGTRAIVQTRLGSDRTTLVYHGISELEGVEVPLAGETDEQNRQAYEALPEVARGSIAEDTENWTPWSVPYRESGQPLLNTGPRRFAQVRIALESDVTTNSARIDSVAFEFSRPTMARRVAGQIEPRTDVDLGALRTFTYRLRPSMGDRDIGFDTVEILTPVASSVRSVSVGGRQIPESEYAVEGGEELLRVRLLDSADRVTRDGEEVEIVFDSRVLVYGTVFEGRVGAGWQPELLAQPVEEERVGDLTVRGSEQSLGEVLGRVRARPAVFTPNGDGINDRVAAVFQVFQVIGAAPLSVEVYDLSGRRVARLFDGVSQSASYEVEWDGRDESGRLLPPGIYLLRAELRGDQRNFVQEGLVGLAH